MPQTPVQPRLRRAAHRVVRSAGVALAALLLVTCSSDSPVGPGRRGIGSLRVAPSFDAFARVAPLALDNVKVIVVRLPAETLTVVSRPFSLTSSAVAAEHPGVPAVGHRGSRGHPAAVRGDHPAVRRHPHGAGDPGGIDPAGFGGGRVQGAGRGRGFARHLPPGYHTLLRRLTAVPGYGGQPGSGGPVLRIVENGGRTGRDAAQRRGRAHRALRPGHLLREGRHAQRHDGLHQRDHRRRPCHAGEDRRRRADRPDRHAAGRSRSRCRSTAPTDCRCPAPP